MQGAASVVPALSPANEIEDPSNRLAPAKGTIAATVLNVFLWVGLFGLGSILTLPR
jgi:hypothetical protein